MSSLSKIFCGIILLTVPTIQYGGYFLLQVLTDMHGSLELTSFQKAMFRAGHAHAGVLVIFSLVAQILVDHAGLSKPLEWVVRIGFPLSAVLVSGGFFGSAVGTDVTEPSSLIAILYVGIAVLFVSLVIIGIGLIRAR